MLQRKLEGESVMFLQSLSVDKEKAIHKLGKGIRNKMVSWFFFADDVFWAARLNITTLKNDSRYPICMHLGRLEFYWSMYLSCHVGDFLTPGNGIFVAGSSSDMPKVALPVMPRMRTSSYSLLHMAPVTLFQAISLIVAAAPLHIPSTPLHHSPAPVVGYPVFRCPLCGCISFFTKLSPSI